MAQAETITISREQFLRALDGWNELVRVDVNPTPFVFRVYPMHVLDWAPLLWRSLAGEDPQEIFLREIQAPYQVEEFRDAFLSHRKLKGYDGCHGRCSPGEALEQMNRYAVEEVNRCELVPVAVRAWRAFQEADKARRQKEKRCGRKGKGGRPVTTDRGIGRGTRRRVYQRDRFQCVYCGVTVIPEWDIADDADRADRATIDHLAPGISDFENLVTACTSCNSAKGNRTPEEAGMPTRHGRFAGKIGG